MTWIVEDNERGNTTEFDRRVDAEERMAELDGLVDAELHKKTASDGGNGADVVDNNDEQVMGLDICVHCGRDINDGHCPDCDGAGTDEPVTAQDITSVAADQNAGQPDDQLPESPGVDEDPVSWMPSHFVDIIEDNPAINRKGYAVLAEHYGIEVTSSAVTYPGETEFQFAEFEATAVTDDGKEYSGFGSAHVDRDDEKTVLGEMAETRAVKRSLALATGVGMTAIEELQSSLGGDE